MPEPFDTIARLRRERMSERKIAAHLGISADVLRKRVQDCAYPLPPTADELRAQEATKIKERLMSGAHPEAVAADLGEPPARVRAAHSRLIAKGDLPPRRKPPKTAHEAWQRQRALGAAPPTGTLADILRQMTPADYDTLLAHHKRPDTTLADTCTRLLKKVLDGR